MFILFNRVHLARSLAVAFVALALILRATWSFRRFPRPRWTAIFAFPALAGILALAGCSSAASNINAVTAALSSPAANQAAANLKIGATALTCAVGNVAAISAAIDKQVASGNALYADLTDVYVVSGTICTALGGTLTSTPAVVVPATASTTAPSS